MWLLLSRLYQCVLNTIYRGEYQALLGRCRLFLDRVYRGRRDDLFRQLYACDDYRSLNEELYRLDRSAYYQLEFSQIRPARYTPLVERMGDVLLLPATPATVSASSMSNLLYDSSGRPLSHANHLIPRYRGFETVSPLPAPAAKIPGRSYYMGFLFFHYGHFILEVVSRLWAQPADQPVDQYVFHLWPRHQGNREQLKQKMFGGYWGDYLRVMGLTPENTVFVDQPLQFEEMLLPQAAIALSGGDCFVSTAGARLWREVNRRMAAASMLQERPEKIYVSRRSVNAPTQNRQCRNEMEIEALFVALGFLRPVARATGLRV